MFTIILEDGVEDNILEACLWYENQKSGLSEGFLKEIEDSYRKLEEQPFLYSKVWKSYRHLILKHFPFVMAFEIKGTDVIVFAVTHTSRNPKEKFKGR